MAKEDDNTSDAEIICTNDLATLEHLTEDSIVHHLGERLSLNIVYTYIGDILIAVNPFTKLDIYNDKYCKLYQNAVRSKNPPHIFAVADSSYQSMIHSDINQCIVISGESGSGKTESFNLLVQQLTVLGKAPDRKLEDKILQVNPLLESFGNAKTAINENSSRFGKYIEMIFSSTGKIIGAKLSEYLLEKSRVVHQSLMESNFHILYYIHDGLAAVDKEGKYHIREYKNYRYLNGYGGDDISMVSVNRVKFKVMQHCFKIIGFAAQDVHVIYCILSSILHIGNIDFSMRESQFQSHACVVDNTDVLYTIADLLGISSDDILDCFITKGMVARGETIVRNNSVQEAISIQHAMAKTLYGKLFSWLVNKVNELLRPHPTLASREDNIIIGLLDIFGFENFVSNSFEQLCINITNEQIQYYFNEHIFAWEIEEYRSEGIDGDPVSFIDNRPVLDMFLGRPMGLLALLDEESNFPKSTDQTLIEKFHKNIQAPCYIKHKTAGLHFTVAHYAGKVQYTATSFLEKNRDRLAIEVTSLLQKSSLPLVRTLFQSPISKTGAILISNGTSATVYDSRSPSPTSSLSSDITICRSKSSSSLSSLGRNQQTVVTYFRYSLMDLLSKLVAGTPHFVRCIRSNVKNEPGHFDTDKVLDQLKYTGVLQTVNIRKRGYSHRIIFKDFIDRYRVLGFKYDETALPNRESCQVLLERIGLKNWAIGTTKVFLKYHHIEQLVRQYEEYKNKIVLAQSVIRTKMAGVIYKLLKIRHKSAVKIQKVTRGWECRRNMKFRETSAVTIQKHVRGYVARKVYTPILEKRRSSDELVIKELPAAGVTSLQSVNVAKKFVQNLKEQSQWARQKYTAAVNIQKNVRRWSIKRKYQELFLKKSHREVQFIYFSQQVELHSNEMLEKLSASNNKVTADSFPEVTSNSLTYDTTENTPPSLLDTPGLSAIMKLKDKCQKVRNMEKNKTHTNKPSSKDLEKVKDQLVWDPVSLYGTFYDTLHEQANYKLSKRKIEMVISSECSQYYDPIANGDDCSDNSSKAQSGSKNVENDLPSNKEEVVESSMYELAQQLKHDHKMSVQGKWLDLLATEREKIHLYDIVQQKRSQVKHLGKVYDEMVSDEDSPVNFRSVLRNSPHNDYNKTLRKFPKEIEQHDFRNVLKANKGLDKTEILLRKRLTFD